MSLAPPEIARADDRPPDDDDGSRPGDSRLCRSCWRRWAPPRFDTCKKCFFRPEVYRVRWEGDDDGAE